MSAGPGRGLLQVTMANEAPSLEELERVYTSMVKGSRAKAAVQDLLRVVFAHCTISPFDASIIYPGGEQSLSSLGTLIRFFACGKDITEMPPDAPQFLAFLKSRRMSTANLCHIKMTK